MSRALCLLLLLVGCTSKTAGPVIPTAAFQQTWTTNAVLLVGIGDSITAGFGARPGYSYFDRLVTNPPGDSAHVSLSTVLPNLRALNLSVSSSTSLGCLEKQLPKLPAQLSNVVGLVVMTTGGNDIIHSYGRMPPKEGAMFGATWEQAQPWIANYEQRLNDILAGVKQNFPGGCHIFLANIYDPTDGTGKVQTKAITLPDWPDALKILAAYNDIIARTAAKYSNVHLVDIHTAFAGHGIYQSGAARWYHENVEDPNERGYDALRRLFLAEIAKRLGP